MTGASDDIDLLLAESAGSLFSRHCGRSAVLDVAAGDWMADLWSVVERAELPLVAVADEDGGSGGTATQWALVLRAAARQCAPIPLGETGVAGWLLSSARIDVPAGPLTAAVAQCGASGSVSVSGVPYARHASALALLIQSENDEEVALVPRDRYEVLDARENLAGEPRDDVRIDLGEVKRGPVSSGYEFGMRLRLAFVRTVQIAGALETLLEITLEHARDRVQFGTPLARMPAIRERLVLLAEEVEAAGAVAECACDGLSEEDALVIGAAKVRAGEAAGSAARIAHQIHGAIGTTREHQLHLVTRRLWSWREEDGNERRWSELVGQELIERGGDSFWPALAAS